MRAITEHRFDSGGFDETVRNLVRNSPWWMTSLVVHLVALLVLWNIPVTTAKKEAPVTLTAYTPKDVVQPEEKVEIDPEPQLPPEALPEVVLDDPDDAPAETDTDNPTFDETAGELGDANAPFTGPSNVAAIGIGGGAGGGKGGHGGPRNHRGTGGSGLTENAVELALRWLADHQDMDAEGGWDCDNFMRHDPANDRCDGAGHPLYDVGVSGLALLAFLGANYTDRGTHPFARHVRAGLSYLIRSQDDEGCFGTRSSKHFMYNHAIATLAMAEAYWMTRNPRYKKPAQDGLDFISAARNPYLAWRYEPRGGVNDTSVTGWMVMALKSGKFGGLQIDPDAFEGARRWIDKVTDPDFGQVGYDAIGTGPARPEGLQERWPAEKSQSMTAVGMLVRIFLGEDPRTSEVIRKGADLCRERLPEWNPDDGSIDMYYWYYGTLAMFQVGGRHWVDWNKAMTKSIVGHQHPRDSGARTGSWDPLGPWGPDGGRVYATACLAMCLEVYYRYDKVFGAGK